ncbi:MAG: hypothetical protein QXY98_03480 [Thermoplasmata archaeon]
MPSKSSRRSDASRLRAVVVRSESARNMGIIRESISHINNIAHGIDFKVERFPRKKISDNVLSALIGLRLTDPNKRDARAFDSFALRDFERRVLADEATARGVPYEACGLMRFYREFLNGANELFPAIHVIVSDRLLMSWSEDDSRYHARAILLGLPCIISMSGLVEAPARPREYYLEKQAIGILGGTDVSLKRRFAGKYLEFDDERTPIVLGGYILQCLFYAMTGEAFCDDRDCMLFNAHWQEEMLHAQIESGKLCARHQKMLARHVSLLKRPS